MKHVGPTVCAVQYDNVSSPELRLLSRLIPNSFGVILERTVYISNSSHDCTHKDIFFYGEINKKMVRVSLLFSLGWLMAADLPALEPA